MNGRNWVLLILFVVFLGVVWWLLRNSRREGEAEPMTPYAAPDAGSPGTGQRPDAPAPIAATVSDDVAAAPAAETAEAAGRAGAAGAAAVAETTREPADAATTTGVPGAVEVSVGETSDLVDDRPEDVSETAPATGRVDEDGERAYLAAASGDLAELGRIEAERSGAVTDENQPVATGAEAHPAEAMGAGGTEADGTAPEEQVNVHWDGVEGTSDEPAVDEPAVEESASDEPAVEESASDESAVDEPAVDEPAVDEPESQPAWHRVDPAAAPEPVPEPAEPMAVVSGGHGEPEDAGRAAWDLEADEGAEAPHDHGVWDGGWGVGSAAPNDDGCMPLGHPIKGIFAFGNVYQAPASSWYAATVADVWFTDEGTAQRAGFRRGEG